MGGPQNSALALGCPVQDLWPDLLQRLQLPPKTYRRRKVHEWCKLDGGKGRLSLVSKGHYAMQVEELLVSLIVIWVAAKALGQLAERLGQPAVLGELVGGVLVGKHVLGLVPDHEFIHLLAQIGVILLLFEIGLETDLIGLLRVGPKAGAVALVGMVLPMAGGYGIALLFSLGYQAAILLGAALSATSIAIAARTLSDLGESGSEEGRIAIGAAVLDDVLGIVILGVVAALVQGASVSVGFIALATAKAVLFLGLALVLGHFLARPLLRLVDTMTVRGALVTASLSLAMGLAVVAQKVGSAPIIGAFAAGLILARTHRAQLIEDRLRPIASVFVPIFFIRIGSELDPSVLNPLDPANRATLFMAAAVVVVAFGGKLLCGFAAWGKGVRHLLLGSAMTPRGEVVLVFAQIGRSEGILGPSVFAVLVITVFVTAVAAPVIMTRLSRGSGARPAAEEGD
jgi:Kef-type K+ transport system membrane component KefB